MFAADELIGRLMPVARQLNEQQIGKQLRLEARIEIYSVNSLGHEPIPPILEFIKIEEQNGPLNIERLANNIYEITTGRGDKIKVKVLGLWSACANLESDDKSGKYLAAYVGYSDFFDVQITHQARIHLD